MSENPASSKSIIDQAGKLINSAWLDVLSCLDLFISNNLISPRQQDDLLNSIRGSMQPLVDIITKERTAQIKKGKGND